MHIQINQYIDVMCFFPRELQELIIYADGWHKAFSRKLHAVEKHLQDEFENWYTLPVTSKGIKRLRRREFENCTVHTSHVKTHHGRWKRGDVFSIFFYKLQYHMRFSVILGKPENCEILILDRRCVANLRFNAHSRVSLVKVRVIGFILWIILSFNLEKNIGNESQDIYNTTTASTMTQL